MNANEAAGFSDADRDALFALQEAKYDRYIAAFRRCIHTDEHRAWLDGLTRAQQERLIEDALDAIAQDEQQRIDDRLFELHLTRASTMAYWDRLRDSWIERAKEQLNTPSKET